MTPAVMPVPPILLMMLVLLLVVLLLLLSAALAAAMTAAAPAPPNPETNFFTAFGAALGFGEPFFLKEALFAGVKNEFVAAILAMKKFIAGLKRRRFGRRGKTEETF